MNICQTLKNAWEGFCDFCRSLEEAHRHLLATPTKCWGCQQVSLYKDLRPTFSAAWVEATDSSFSREFGRQIGLEEKRIRPHSYCPTCWEPIQEERTRVRAFIRKEHARQQRIAQSYPKEARLVDKHNQRAFFAGGDSSLTIEQWIITLEHYDWRCAYCGGSYEELEEHRIPIDRGDGTTAKNCVPSCQSCNRRKGALHPEEILAREISLSPAAHRRIEAEMETLQGTQLIMRSELVDSPAQPYGKSLSERVREIDTTNE